jgi:pilus assembly protein Flp/PilA
MIEHLKMWTQLKSDRRGVTAMEYGIIAALIITVVVAAMALLGPQIASTFAGIGSALTTATP